MLDRHRSKLKVRIEMMEIKQLKYFVEVAKREHISEAALELNIAQSAISRQMTQLEKN